jgi:hypothetical protein
VWVGWQLVERGEGDPLERDGTEARLGLRRFDAAVSECSAHVDDAGLPVDVALLERDPFAGSQAGRRREDHDRAVAWAAVFAATGGYHSPQTFTNGFAAAMVAASALALAGAVAGLTIPPRRDPVSDMTRSASASVAEAGDPA